MTIFVSLREIVGVALLLLFLIVCLIIYLIGVIQDFRQKRARHKRDWCAQCGGLGRCVNGEQCFNCNSSIANETSIAEKISGVKLNSESAHTFVASDSYAFSVDRPLIPGKSEICRCGRLESHRIHHG